MSRRKKKKRRPNLFSIANKKRKREILFRQFRLEKKDGGE
jgi:hypothetical protein